MKKFIILFVALLCVTLSSCSIKDVEKVNSDANTSMFVQVEMAGTWAVVYHKDTKVMYAVSYGAYNNGTFTLLVDRDGKPLTWKGGVQ